MSLVRDGAGRPDNITAMLEDISGRKEVEADLVVTATGLNMLALGAMAGGITWSIGHLLGVVGV